MNRHKHYLRFDALQSLLNLPEDELILTVHVDPHSRTIWLECLGGPPTSDGAESTILSHTNHTLPLD